jgi:hypothetical protein
MEAIMNWYNDFRRVYFVKNMAERESRRKGGLGFFGWLGLMVWLVVGAAYCSHKADAQQGMDAEYFKQQYRGVWMMDCTDPMLCLPLRKGNNVHVYDGQTACETDMVQVLKDMPSGRRIMCLPTTYQNSTAPPPVWRNPEPLNNRTTDCAWYGGGAARRFICTSR